MYNDMKMVYNISSSGPGNLGLLRQSVSGEANTGVNYDSGNSGSEPDSMSASHTLVINSAGSHQHTFTTNSTGSANTFNVMQPTLFIVMFSCMQKLHKSFFFKKRLQKKTLIILLPNLLN